MDISNQFNSIIFKFDSIYKHINSVISKHIYNFQDYKEAYKFQTLLLLGLVKNDQNKCLDMGCGHGFLGMILSRLGWEYYGIDDMADYAVNYSGDELQAVLGADAELHQWSGFTLIKQDIFQKTDFQDNEFDVGLFSDVIEHVHKSPRPILEEFYRVIKPGGKLVCIAPNAVNLRKRLHVVLGKSNYQPVQTFYNSVGDWRGHVREPTLTELELMLTWAGFQIDRSFTVDFDYQVDKYLKGRQALRKIYQVICKWVPTLRQNLICIGSKPHIESEQ